MKIKKLWTGSFSFLLILLLFGNTGGRGRGFGENHLRSLRRNLPTVNKRSNTLVLENIDNNRNSYRGPSNLNTFSNPSNSPTTQSATRNSNLNSYRTLASTHTNDNNRRNRANENTQSLSSDNNRRRTGSENRVKNSTSLNSNLNKLLRYDSSSSRWSAAAAICHSVPGLSRQQMEECVKAPDAAGIAVRGLQLAVTECATQMAKNRWNCSSLQGTLNPQNTQILQKGYRESAFGHAISSAGVTYAVAKACSQGKLLSCGCGFQYDEPTNFFPGTDSDFILTERTTDISLKRGTSTNWKWAGCSHNMEYGMKFAKKFLDSRERSTDLPSRINLHNNRVGRLAVANSMEVRCKCHGLSGSCELRTCWRSAPDFRSVGAELKNKFRRAVLIDETEFGNRPYLPSANSRRKRREDKNKKGKIDLWYYERSPTYCDSNSDFNFPGTSGRRCNRTESGPGSCSTLCCGRGYNTIRQVYTTRCNCLFKWCCEVICETCTVDEWITVCK